MVGSLFSWKSLFTNRRTSDDFPTACGLERTCQLGVIIRVRCTGWHLVLTASPRSTSLTLLEGLGALESAIANQSDVAWLSYRVGLQIGLEVKRAWSTARFR